MFSGCPMRRPISLPVGACGQKQSLFSNGATASTDQSAHPPNHQPDVIREALALKRSLLKSSKTENNLMHLNQPSAGQNGGGGSAGSRNCLTFDNLCHDDHIVVLVDDEYRDVEGLGTDGLDAGSGGRKAKAKRQRKRDRLTKSCIAQ
jgi:hypothetical protein